MKTTALAAALLICSGSLAFAQSTGTTSGTAGTHNGTMATSPSSSSMGSGSTGGTHSGTTSSMNSGATGGTAGSSTAMSGSTHPISSEDQLKSELKAKGYSDISNVKHEGNKYTANAKQDGKSVKVQVDASNGTVTKEGG